LKVVESAILVSICGVHKLVVPLIYLSLRNLSAGISLWS
jgi:hypothetical protein